MQVNHSKRKNMKEDKRQEKYTKTSNMYVERMRQRLYLKR